MKKLLLISAILLSVTACKEQSAQENISREPVSQKQELTAESLSDYDKAKATLDELFLHAKRLKNGKISKEKHDVVSYPIGQKFMAQRAALNEEDKKKLSEYGLRRFDEVYPEEDRVVVNEW